MVSNIVLVGFSGTGKTKVAEAVAKVLGWKVLDTDQEIEHIDGKLVHEIFKQDGESRFRDLERKTVARACSEPHTVISLGGGAIMDSNSRELAFEQGLVICLEARPDTIYQRLKGDPEGATRPLVAGKNALGRIQELKRERQWAYSLSDWTVHTDSLTVEEVTHEVIRAWSTLRSDAKHDPTDPDLAAVVHGSSGSYPVYAGWGILEDQLGTRLDTMGMLSKIYIITEENVFNHHGRVLQKALHKAGIEFDSLILPPGEPTKNLDTLKEVYRWLAEHRAERSHTILSLGGGMVGDLAGFVAATYLRGISLVQIPTSLVAMVDSSIGGKTGVNLTHGKNLVGAFHQPRMVLSDVEFLTTMPQRELLEGWAEAIKHGLILDKELFQTFEDRSQDLMALDPELVSTVVKRNVAIKAEVVSGDEFETKGSRRLLNYGHTIGHALEAVTQYGTYLHGEAVSLGMMGAALIGVNLGVTPECVVQRQKSVLRNFNLPVRFEKIDSGTIVEAMTMDKKVVKGDIRWVLLEEIGRGVVDCKVPKRILEQVLRELSV